ncbi:MAG: hypothetical protein AMXMBFR82_53170 [Candidatus Hydrogenedentota bacterium]
MKDKKPQPPSEMPTVVHQLSDAEATLRAIVSGQIDSIVDPLTGATRILQEAQTALLESEERYHRLVNRIAVVILELEPSGTIRFANEALLHVLGFDSGDVVGSAFAGVFADPRDPGAAEAFWNTVHREDVTKYELRIASKTGAIRMLEITSANQFGADGVPTRIILCGTDETERKRALEDLQESEQRYRSLFTGNPDGVFAVNLEGTLTSINDSAVTLTGYTLQELQEKRLEDLVASDCINEVLERIQSTVEGEPQRFEARGIRKSGETIEIKITTLPIKVRGRIAGIYGIVKDISATRLLERALFQAQKMESIGRLAGSIAHDFNNLLGAILGFSDFLYESLPEDSEQRADVDEIRHAGRRASDLTRQLLTFARKQVVEPQVFNVNDLVKNVDKLLRRLMGEHIEVVTLFDEGIGEIRIDKGQFEQLLVNLAVNARDAMPNGGKLIVETQVYTAHGATTLQGEPLAPGEYVLLNVTDSGLGMTPEALIHACEPFFTTKPEGKGTGLGLATCFGIVTQAGGHIGFYSEPDHGTSVKILLPTVEGGDENVLHDYVDSQLTVDGTETILLAEDEPLLRELVQRTLTRHGYTVLVASGGTRALALARSYNGRIDCLITDMVMPHMGGKELAETLLLERPDMTVIFMSGYSEVVLAERGIVGPDMHFLAKPFMPKQLLEKVRTVLNRAKDAAHPGSPSN